MDCTKRTFLRMVRSLGCVTCVGAALVSTAQATTVIPLQLAAIEIVDLQDRSHTAWTRLSNRQPPSMDVVLLSFSSDVDLADLAQKNTYHVVRRAWICTDEVFDKAKNLRGDSGVYDDIGYIDAYRESKTPPGEKVSAFNYYVYIDLKSPSPSVDSDVIQYDLRQNPTDVCVDLVGGSPTHKPFASSTLRISKSALIEAVRGAQQK
jgi:hypothetical protein